MHAVFILNGLSHWICQRLHNKTLNALSFVQVKKKKKDGQWFFVRQRFPGENNSNYGVVQPFGDTISKGPYATGLEFHILFSRITNYHLQKGNKT